MNDALKPCPFCGEELIPTQSGDGYTHNRSVRNANNCVFSWVVIRPPHHSAWNTRAAATVVAVKPTDCEWCIGGLQADGETPCPCQAAPADPLADERVQRLVEAVKKSRSLTAEAAAEGFNYAVGDWAERMYAHNGELSAALAAILTRKPRQAVAAGWRTMA